MVSLAGLSNLGWVWGVTGRAGWVVQEDVWVITHNHPPFPQHSSLKLPFPFADML